MTAAEQEHEILRILGAKGRLLGRDLFEAISKGGSTDKETFLDAMDSLRAAEVIQVTPLRKHFSNFMTYLTAYEFSWPFWLVVTLSVVIMSTVALASDVFPWGFVRLLFGAGFLVLVPGFSLERLLFGTDAGRDSFERFALSIGLSLSVVPILAILLSYTPSGLNVFAVTAILTFLSLVAITAASYRDYLFWKMRFDAASHAG